MANKLTDRATPGLFAESETPATPAKRTRAPRSEKAKAAAKKRANAKRQKVSASGFYWMTSRAYHANPCPAPAATSGVLRKIVDRSPAHARAASPELGGAATETTEAMDIGSALHDARLAGIAHQGRWHRLRIGRPRVGSSRQLLERR